MRKPNYDNASKIALLAKLRERFNADVITMAQLKTYVAESNIDFPYFILRENKVGRGKFSVTDSKPVVAAKSAAAPAPAPAMATNVVHIATKRAVNATESFIPDTDPTYVNFGFHVKLKDILKSKIFYPVYVTGLSGNGKTFMIEQVCAQLKRELIRVNITKRTDETDLIGSYELVDGNTIRREGPVVTAMRRGAVLLLDETDYGTEDLLCLQPILEGKPYFDKKSGELIYPAPGFTIIATANTKGKGSEDGRFIGANVLNEAFLERFAITVEQEYPTAAVETKILEKNFEKFGLSEPEFVKNLVSWADIIRKSFDDGAVDDVISTRRLVHIVNAYMIFKDRLTSIEMCLNRFDADTKASFYDLYTKIDASVAPAATVDPTKDLPEAQAPF